MNNIVIRKKFQNYYETFMWKGLQAPLPRKGVWMRSMNKFCKHIWRSLQAPLFWRWAGVGLFFFLAILPGCKQKAAPNEDEATTETHTPVTVTSLSYDPIEEFIVLNATSAFLQKSYVKSNLTGYVKKVNIKLGDFVNNGQTLFVL